MPNYEFTLPSKIFFDCSTSNNNIRDKHASSTYDLTGINDSSDWLWLCPEGIYFDIMVENIHDPDTLLYQNVTNRTSTKSLNNYNCIYFANPRYTKSNLWGSMPMPLSFVTNARAPYSWTNDPNNELKPETDIVATVKGQSMLNSVYDAGFHDEAIDNDNNNVDQTVKEAGSAVQDVIKNAAESKPVKSGQTSFPAISLLSASRPLKGQKHRSSLNYHFDLLSKSDRVIWMTEKGISFDVKEDIRRGIDPVTFRNLKDGSITSYPSKSACNGLYVADPKAPWLYFEIYAASITDSFIYTNWMRRIPDNTRLSNISIPGTHGSGASLTWLDEKKCQNLELLDQLGRRGVRFLDIACSWNGHELRVSHNGKDQGYSLQEVFDNLIFFLNCYPTETVILMLRKDGDFITDQDFANKFSETVYPNIRGKLVQTSSIPTMGQSRGKILLLKRFPSDNKINGIDFWTDWQDNSCFTINNCTPKIFIQDQYKDLTPQEKYELVSETAAASTSSENNCWTLNFANCYEDWPNRKCNNIAHYINTQLSQKIKSMKFKGVLIMDFLDQNQSSDDLKISWEIINKNF